jgi:hypothetical protein
VRLLAVAALAGCVSTADPLDRPCPCAAQFVCCERLETCVRREEIVPLACAPAADAEGPADAPTTIDAIPDRDASVPERGAIVDLAAESATPDAAAVCEVQASYYPSTDLTGHPVVGTEPFLHFAWGARAPALTIPADSWSALFSADLVPDASDDYTFSMNADDGARLWLDGELLLDWWRVSIRPVSTTVTLRAGRPYRLAIEYFEAVGTAALDLTWHRPGAPPAAIPSCALTPAPAAPSSCSRDAVTDCIPAATPACTGVGTGLGATYYRWPGFTDLQHTESNVPVMYQFAWVPEPARYQERYTARWDGFLEAPTSETFNFYLASDGQAELTIAGQSAATVLADPSGHEAIATVALTAGQRYPIRVQYVDGHAAAYAAVQLRWKSASIPKGAIPLCRLFPRGG